MGKVVKNTKELEEHVKHLKNDGKTIVMVNGCFDLFHVGHLDLLKNAKSHGDILVVSVNSDTSVKRNKGNSRPIIPENERILILSSIIYVDIVVMFDDGDPGRLIQIIKPNYIVKESEYREKTISEIKVIQECGCELVFYDRNYDVSTSTIIDKINDELYSPYV